MLSGCRRQGFQVFSTHLIYRVVGQALFKADRVRSSRLFGSHDGVNVYSLQSNLPVGRRATARSPCALTGTHSFDLERTDGQITI